MITVPEGYTEQEVLDAIDGAVRSLSSSFSFGYFDEGDMFQEGFIFACDALPRFNPNNKQKCGLKNFLRVHVRNQFINLRRNKLHRNSPPCSSCQHNDDHKCEQYNDRSECPKWAGWYSRNQAKRSLVESCDASKVTHVTPMDELDVCSKLSRSELLQRVSNEIPLDMRGDYCRLIEGAKLTKPRREAVVKVVRELLGDVIHDEE